MVHRRPPAFSREALEEVRECLDPNAADIIADLQDLLTRYPDAKTFAERDFPKQRHEAVRQLRSLIAALQAARRYFDPRDSDARPEWREDLDRLEGKVTAHLETLERLFDMPEPNARGRRRNEPRRWLANATAYVLQWHGIPLTKGHGGGAFHTVLMRVVEAAEGKIPPDDLFPLVRETADLFRQLDVDALEKLDPRLIGLLRLKGAAKRSRRLKPAQRDPATRQTPSR